MDQQPSSTSVPIRYYGGKQNMLKHLLPLLPEHRIYVEGFVGGGALFWTKPPSSFEVINDTNGRLLAFYKAIKYDFGSLERLIDETFHAREQFNETKAIYHDPNADEIEVLAMAWAIWVQANQGFAGQMGNSWGYDRSGKEPSTLYNKKKRFTDAYKERMRFVTVEQRDALKVIDVFDSPHTFFYLDPPYVSAHQGHYKGYTREDFKLLLDKCATMQGKFLLSSYPEPDLLEYRARLGWNVQDHEQTLAVTSNRAEKKKKIECLTWNYAL
ncbi:DNA adenine methylase [Fibrella forsythiae]|uniref:DNA adenine methylase n=1 Tax=Fibrella forsythiae TaxID=2817061 RepID=A0ABS3JEL3_9BACT|nr:DNA adenine methylase [Fibrella forsythiae]MBO0947312.1 DNA adenine methylase [Fibrella forsythiae]